MRRPGPPRWRCLIPDCPYRRWQPAHGPGDPMQVALAALERHYAARHTTKETKKP